VTLLMTLAAAVLMQAPAVSVAGTWVISVESHQLGLGIEQDGTTVSGTLVAMGRQIPVDGQFVDRVLTMTSEPSETGASPESAQFKLKGRLKDDGTMEGELTTPHGTLKWTAERLKPPSRSTV